MESREFRGVETKQGGLVTSENRGFEKPHMVSFDGLI